MMNRLRTILVSVTAVAVAMMVLGSNAQAQSVSTAHPHNYLGFLERLAEREIDKGVSLMERYSSLERTTNILEILENIPHPSPWLAKWIATQENTIYNQEWRVFSKIQNNTNALLATQAKLQVLPPKEELQVSNILESIQRLVVAERGVATPVR